MPFTALQNIQNSKKNNSFVGVFRYVKTSGVKSTKQGELYGFLEISSQGDFPAERVAHMAWDGVVEGYMYSQTKSISESLKSGIQEFTRRLKDLMRNSKELEEKGIDVNLVIISATKEGIYVANLGESEIFAYRGEKIVDVVDILEKNNAQTAGFPMSKSDLLVISTPSLLSENMHTLVGKNDREEILKSLNLLGKTILPNQGMFCVYQQRDTQKEPEKEQKTNIKVTKTERKKKTKERKDQEGEPRNQLFKEQISKQAEKIKSKKTFLKTKQVLLKILSFVKRIFKSIWEFLKKVFSKIGIFLRSKLGNKKWFKKYAAKASQVQLKKKSPNIKIDGYKTKNLRAKRIKIAVLCTLAVVAIVGGYQYARKQKALRELHAQADTIFQEVNSNLEDARGSLNKDSEEAEKKIFAATNRLDEVPEGLSEEYLEEKQNLEQEVLGVKDDLYKRVIVNPDSFIGFFDEGTNLTDMEYVVDDSGNELLIITDKGTSSVWEVYIYDKSSNRMADNDGVVESPEYVDIGNEGDIFVYDSEVGVLKSSNSSSGWGAFETLTGVGVGNIGIDEVGEFAVLTASDNLYYLDTTNSRIMKSVNYGTGYSSTVVNVINDEKFINANDFFADFSIYVLTSGNDGVLRYSAGSYVPVSVVGVNGDIGDLLCGDTSGNTESGFYVFDSENKRILKLEKPIDSYNNKLHPNELVLVNQYIYRGDEENMWSNVKEIVVDREEEHMYILDGNNVWKIGL
jgi:hypothetical protein